MNKDCEAGCYLWNDTDIRHNKNCKNYPDSMSWMIDVLQSQVALLKKQLTPKE